MKIHTILLIISTLICTQFCSLKKDPIRPIDENGGSNLEAPKIKTPYLIMQMKGDSIQITATFITKGNLNIQEYGWVWDETDKNPQPEIGGNSPYKGIPGSPTKDTFMMKLGKFSLNTNYSIRAYVKTGKSPNYQEIQKFEMNLSKLGIPKLTRVNDACQASFSASIESSSNTPPIRYGFLYNTINDTSTAKKSVVLTGLADKLIQVTLTGLDPGTQYFIWAFADNQGGRSISPNFLTHTTPPRSFGAVDFSINTRYNVFEGARIEFYNQTQGKAKFTWDYGDGQTHPVEDTVYIFMGASGDKTIKLRAEEGGCKEEKSKIISFEPDPFKTYFVEVVGGTFTMGCTDTPVNCSIASDAPQLSVTLKTYSIGKTEITHELWALVMGSYHSSYSGCKDCPVERVSWDSIQVSFLDRLFKKKGINYYLPTEAEWEFAARGGIKSVGYTHSGGNITDVSTIAWHNGNTTRLQSVATKQYNELMIYDMSGNVAEWCCDRYGAYPTGPLSNPACIPTPPGSTPIKVVRGGAINRAANSLALTVYARSSSASTTTSPYIGFRLVRKP